MGCMSPPNSSVAWSSHVSVYVVFEKDRMWKFSQFVACKWLCRIMCLKKS